jgi:hypothetical protein
MNEVLSASRADEVYKQERKVDWWIALVSLEQRSQATLRLQQMNVKDGVKEGPASASLRPSRL